MNSKDISRSYDRREIEALIAKSHVETEQKLSHWNLMCPRLTPEPDLTGATYLDLPSNLLRICSAAYEVSSETITSNRWLGGLSS